MGMLDSETKKILIADNSQTFLMYIGILLKRMGFTIVPAENGAEVLRLLHMCNPDVIMLDTKLDKVDSVAVVTEIKNDKQTSHIPVIMVSVDANSETVETYKKIGCSGYLTKPVRTDTLHTAIQECVFYPRGTKRKYLRVSFERKVTVVHNGMPHELYTETLSEMGAYIRSKDPFPVNSELEIILPLTDTDILHLRGKVIYQKGLFGYILKVPPGMGIKFKDITEDQAKKLKVFVQNLLTEGISDIQEETGIET